MAQFKISDIAISAGGIILIGTFGVGLWLAFSSSPSQKTQPFRPSHKMIIAQKPAVKISAMQQAKPPKPALIIAPLPKPKIEKTENIQELKRLALGKDKEQKEVIAVLSSHHMVKCQEKKIACQKLELSFLPMKQSFDLWQNVSDTAIDSDMVEVRSVALDPSNEIEQLLISGKLDKNIVGFFWYGIEEGKAQSEWHLMPVPYTYKGVLPEIILGENGASPVLRVRDLEFAKIFAPSHSDDEAENYAPLKLLRFENGHFIITWNNSYHAFFLQDLMSHLPPQKEEAKDKRKLLLTNEWLAYYVTTLTMMGHFHQAWAYMLLHREVADENFVKMLRANLLKESLISEQDYKEAPLHYSHLPFAEKKHFKVQKTLFDMLPHSEKQLLMEKLTH